MVAHACNLSVGDGETGKDTGESVISIFSGETPSVDLWSPHMHTTLHIPVHMHEYMQRISDRALYYRGMRCKMG